MVFLRLQPYKQTSIKASGVEKLKPQFYGLYKVIKKIGGVAYELQIPSTSWIHNIFHVSRLKKVLGQHITPCLDLPPLDDEGRLILEPETILRVGEKKLRNRTIEEYLIKWKGLQMEDTTWEGSQILDHPNLRGIA